MDVDDLQPYLGIAVSILATQDVSAIQNLKDFLVSMPSSKHIEQTLGLAVVQLAEQDPSAFEWVLLQRALLLPELDLQAFVKKIAVDRLCSKGQAIGSDFDGASQWPLLSDGKPEAILHQYFSQGERLLLKSVLLRDDGA